MNTECYKILGIKETASIDEIKDAFRNLAIKHHPDKNPGKEEISNQIFIRIRNAYEKLMDSCEKRPFNRSQDPLSDSDEVMIVNPRLYRTANAFFGFDDSDTGFYTVYRELFRTIFDEEMCFLKDHIPSAPDFGYSFSDVNEVVMPFYSYWMNFRTAKSLRKCRYRYVNEENDLPCLKTGRKRYNRDIKSLVKFMSRKDPRVPRVPKKKRQNLLPSPNARKVEKSKTHSEDIPCFKREQHNEKSHDGAKQVEDLMYLLANAFCDNIKLLRCNTCHTRFRSGKALFEHILESGHVELNQKLKSNRKSRKPRKY